MKADADGAVKSSDKMEDPLEGIMNFLEKLQDTRIQKKIEDWARLDK